jgi:hypothetical protein
MKKTVFVLALALVAGAASSGRYPQGVSDQSANQVSIPWSQTPCHIGQAQPLAREPRPYYKKDRRSKRREEGIAAPEMVAPAAPMAGTAFDGAAEISRAPSAEAPPVPSAPPSVSKPSKASRADAAILPVPPKVPRPVEQAPLVTAGVTDDNAKWTGYLDYLSRANGVEACKREVEPRYQIRLKDRDGKPALDALVSVSDGNRLVWSARTDAQGQTLFLPAALYRNGLQARGWKVTVQSQNQRFTVPETIPSDDREWDITLPFALKKEPLTLDVAFVIDATGSMGDEIEKLKASMDSIAAQIAQLPARPLVRYALVSYKDRGDEYVVRSSRQFQPSVDGFRRELAKLQAGGGGDTPEDVNAALNETVRRLPWQSKVRLAIVVGDAAPHLDYTDQPYSYDVDSLYAAAQSIKIFPIGASGLESVGEYVFRQMAQITGGKFFFLTYKDARNPASGAGYDTTMDVDSYSVDTLDKLVVRVVQEELAGL